ncbi:hypothetical protein HPB51_029035 [Rhipicephalus microplus]|uniref:Uncharacterized protein n=1 Tax=Rhipicephalus microplus TaxID=6941 RepID=A0A9J6CVA2_RHIMP|nr:hypothetical protein HPB51_029035 [Rhipicephalus microplus]
MLNERKRRYDPELGLPFYWDPRYNDYFYRGNMPSPTGTEALQSLYAAPTVELISTESPSVTTILVHRDDEGYRTRPSTGKRITWVLSEDPQEAEQWDIPCSVPTLLVVAITLSVVTFTAFFLFIELIKEQDAPKEESTSEGEAEGRGLHLAHLNALGKGMVPLKNDAQLWLSSRVATRRTGSPVSESAPDALAYPLPALRKVCIGSKSVHSQPGPRDDELSPTSSPAPCCDAIILCCATVNDNLTLQPPPFQTNSSNVSELILRSAHCHRRTARKVIIGVRFSDATLSRLANEKRERRSSFFRSVLGSLNASGFNGLAILLQDTPESRDESVASVIGVLSRKLRRHNYTLALVLPYTVRGGEAYRDKILALTKILASSDHLFLYPDARMLENATFWPSPHEVHFPSRQDKGGRAVPACHMFTSRPFLVSLREACDASKIQAIRKAKQTHLDDIEYACFLWNQSWASRAYRYNTYTCSGQTGIIYQTPEQAQAFYRDLLTQVQSLCYGLVNWDSVYFPSVCLRNKPKLKA